MHWILWAILGAGIPHVAEEYLWPGGFLQATRRLAPRFTEQSFELAQPGEGALDDPTGAAEPGAMLGLAACDLRCDPAQAQLAPVLVVVVAAIGGDALEPVVLGAGPGSVNRARPVAVPPFRLHVTGVGDRSRPLQRTQAMMLAERRSPSP